MSNIFQSSGSVLCVSGRKEGLSAAQSSVISGTDQGSSEPGDSRGSQHSQRVPAAEPRSFHPAHNSCSVIKDHSGYANYRVSYTGCTLISEATWLWREYHSKVYSMKTWEDPLKNLWQIKEIFMKWKREYPSREGCSQKEKEQLSLLTVHQNLTWIHWVQIFLHSSPSIENLRPGINSNQMKLLFSVVYFSIFQMCHKETAFKWLRQLNRKW